MMIKATTLAIMAVFYIAYFAKQIAQRRQGVSTMILGKGDKSAEQKRLELALKVATFTMPAVEIASIWWELMTIPCWLQWMGVVIAAVGVVFFIAGMLTMKGSWRAGIPEKKETSLVTSGIYLISRNPAFVGFDLMYIGTFSHSRTPGTQQRSPSLWCSSISRSSAKSSSWKVPSARNMLTTRKG